MSKSPKSPSRGPGRPSIAQEGAERISVRFPKDVLAEARRIEAEGGPAVQEMARDGLAFMVRKYQRRKAKAASGS